MRILFAARAGTTLILGQSRAPDQARRKLATTLGSTVKIVWVGMPVSGINSTDLITTTAARIGKVSTLVDNELGTVFLARGVPEHIADRDAVGRTVKEAEESLNGRPLRPARILGGLPALARRIQAFVARPSGVSAS